MNMNTNPSISQLRDLLKKCDDTAGHHVLWVKKNGDVVISRITGDPAPAAFDKEHPEMRMRYETFLVGNEYVGADAADDDDWVSELFENLRAEWAKARGESGVRYIEEFMGSWGDRGSK